MLLVLFILQAALFALIFGTHFIALEGALYWKYVWMDVPLHFAGGLWLALASAWALLALKRPLDERFIFSFVILGSIAWEIFEALIGSPREANFLFDTVLDLTMDMAGAIAGFMLARLFAARGTIIRHEETQNDPSESRHSAA